MMSIEEINEIIQNYGVKGAIVIILVVLLISFLKTEAFNKFIEDYYRMMTTLESLGFNINLSPVTDIYVNPKNIVLKERCFGSDPKLVSEFVKAAVKISNEGLEYEIIIMDTKWKMR